MPDLHAVPLARYLDELLPPRDPLLAELEAQAARGRIPISGPQVGRLLALLIRLARPSRALEVGAAIGYAAVWMGRALREHGGALQTIELRPEMAARARSTLARAELSDTVDVLEGAALEVLPRLSGSAYGLIFLDAVKSEYPAYFEHAVEMLTEGGLLLADNALLGGEIAPDAPGGYWPADAREGIRRYNALAFGHPALDSVILPLHDGVTLSLKR
ncbi:MAG TPA: O-methyltransferase [bacterium]|nr:O-methyltransferase [bacterium]